jgi:glycosyltransferase involved in cell wall biosynthesis
VIIIPQDFQVVVIHRLLHNTSYTRQLNEGFKKIGHLNSITLYGWKGEISDDLPNGKGVWTPWLFPFQIFKELMADRPSIVHLQYEFVTFGPLWANVMIPLLLLLIKLAGTRLVITIHAVIPFPVVDHSFVRNFAPALANLPLITTALKLPFILLYRLLTTSAQVVYVHGVWYKKALVRYYKTEASKVRVVPYGIDDDNTIDYTEQNYYSRLLSNKRAVLYFGTVSPRKDIEGLIRAFGKFLQSHSNYLLLIAGNTTLEFRWYGEHLKKVANDLGLNGNVLFLGFVSDSAIHTLYRRADFLVLPYLYGFEGPSGPLAFAVQHGVPVIGTDVGHLREEVHDLEEGLLVPVGDQVALCKAMITLADNPQMRQYLAKNIRKKEKGALWRDVAAETYFEYEKIVKYASAPS